MHRSSSQLNTLDISHYHGTYLGRVHCTCSGTNQLLGIEIGFPEGTSQAWILCIGMQATLGKWHRRCSRSAWQGQYVTDLL